jgi:hypothetical protein
MKITLELGGHAGTGYLIDPRTGEPVACQWTLTCEREAPPAFPWDPRPFVTPERQAVRLEIEFPDDFANAPGPPAPVLPVLALPEADP